MTKAPVTGLWLQQLNFFAQAKPPVVSCQATAGLGSRMESKKLRLLALHSWRTSPAIYAEQVHRAGLDKALQDLVEIDFLQAPNAATGDPPADVAPFFRGPYFEWWNAVKDQQTGDLTYVGLERSVEHVQSHAREQGPYDGIMAMSQIEGLTAIISDQPADWLPIQQVLIDAQGAILTAILLSTRQQATSQNLKEDPLGRFCIMIAGVNVRDHRWQEPAERIALPSLHMIGDRDPVKLASRKLADMFDNPVILTHPKGHVVPALPRHQLEVLRSFLRSQARPSAL